MANVFILGSGGFGTALAVTSFRKGNDVTLWSKFSDEINDIRKHGENKKLLPGIAVDLKINLTTSLKNISNANVIIFAVPSFAVRETAQAIKPFISPQTVVCNVAKGLEAGSLKRLSEVLTEELSKDIVVISGPSHAEELARGMPTTVVAASKNRESAEYIQQVLMSSRLRIYVSDDVVGTELGGALKNIIAVCAGICDGIEFGDNTKAALMTRGIAEISRLGCKMGGEQATFLGLAGIGDLIVTCTSMHSRNRRAGILLGQGIKAEDAVARVGTVEGYLAAKSAFELAKQNEVEMPIVEALNEVLFNNADIKSSISGLMDRPMRHEDDKVWLKSANE